MGRNSSTKKQKKKSLAAGRPPHVRKTKPALAASATRTLIRSHHQLHKELSKAKADGDDRRAEQLQDQIEQLGGLQSYQQASILGQSKDRGGDSSIILMEWLKPIQGPLRTCDPRLRLLEVGALSTANACSKGQIFDIQRIDLKSQSAGILQQDFMQRPLPRGEDEKFNIISLSLVLNYVPDARQRGEMLRRTRQFLCSTAQLKQDSPFPALFIVLPRPCVDNSRYMSRAHFIYIMESIGYRLRHEKLSSKLVYSLWQLTDKDHAASIPKREVNPGAARNNFTIVLDGK